MARRHRCDSAPIGLGHFPVGSNRSGLMVLGARRCRAAMAAAPSAIAASTPRAKGTRGYLDRRNGITGDIAIEVYTQIPRHLLFAL